MSDAIPDNPVLHALYTEDQAECRQWRGAEVFLASQARRARAEALIAAGALHTAADYWHAARLLQHGEALAHWWQGHLLALAAADLGHPEALWLAAAALDRWLLRQDRPQRFGTQSIGDGQGGLRVWDVDPATTDVERAAWNVPSLAALHAQAAAHPRQEPDSLPPPILRGPVGGVMVEITELPPSVSSDHAPPYEPLHPADPRPVSLPLELTAWRFGELFCAKDAADTVVATWHLCGWRVIDPAVTPAVVLDHLAGAPVWLSAPAAYWARLIRPAGPTRAWLVGGTVPPATLATWAASLPEA